MKSLICIFDAIVVFRVSQPETRAGEDEILSPIGNTCLVIECFNMLLITKNLLLLDFFCEGSLMYICMYDRGQHTCGGVGHWNPQKTVHLLCGPGSSPPVGLERI